MADKTNEFLKDNKIIRKDGRDCFVVSLDAFAINKVRLEFAAYDLSRPEGKKFTNHVNIYMDIPEFLQLANELASGRMHRKMLAAKQVIGSKTVGKDEKADAYKPLFFSMGGTPAHRLKEPRADGMGLSRTVKITVAGKKDYFFTAESGPGTETDKGLIVPQYGAKHTVKEPENKISIPMDMKDLEEIFLTTREYYNAWLSAQYILNLNSGNDRKKSSSPKVG